MVFAIKKYSRRLIPGASTTIHRPDWIEFDKKSVVYIANAGLAVFLL